RDLVRQAVAEVSGNESLAADLRRFEFATVYLATLNDMIRRSAHTADSEAVRAEVLAAMTRKEMSALAKSGHVGLAMLAAAARYTFPAYALAYRLFRRVKWGSVGYW